MYRHDPRVAKGTVRGGPPDLVGEEFIYVMPVQIAGREIAVPRHIAGVPEYCATAEAEARANELMPRLLQNLDERGNPPPLQGNAALVIEAWAAVLVCQRPLRSRCLTTYRLPRR